MYQSSNPKKFPKWNASNYCLATNNPAAISLCLPVHPVLTAWSLMKRSLLHASLQKDLSVQSRWQLSNLQSCSSIYTIYCARLSYFFVQVHLHWITVKVFAPQPSGISRIQHTAGACLYGFRHGTCQRGGIHGLMDNNCHTLGILCQGGTSKTHTVAIIITILIYPAGHQDLRDLTPENGGRIKIIPSSLSVSMISSVTWGPPPASGLICDRLRQL